MNWLAHSEKALLDLRNLDLANCTYWVPCFADLGPLQKSIETMGILNPPVVQRRGNDAPIPVLGRRRLQAALELGMEHVEVRLISTDMPELDGFLLAFWDNLAHRCWNTVTRAVVLRRLLELLPRETVAAEFLGLLGVPPRGPVLERLRMIGGLEYSVLRLLAAGLLHEKSAALLAEMASEERLVLLDLIERLGMNANKNAEIVSDLFDLSVFHGKPVSELLKEEPVSSLLADSQLPHPERARLFRDVVRSRKYPEIVKSEKEFSHWCSDMQLGANVTIRPTPGFENEDCTIEVRARSRDHAERIINRLRGEQ